MITLQSTHWVFQGITKALTPILHGPQRKAFNMAYTLQKPPAGIAPSGHRVLLVMGFLAPGPTWSAVASELLSQGHEVLFYDNAGVGHSTWPSGTYRLTTSAMANHALQLLDTLWPNEPVHLVGYSLGGMVALEAAKAAPHRFNSLSLVCTHPGGLSNIFPPWRGFKGMILSQYHATTADTEARARAEAPIMYSDEWMARSFDSATGLELGLDYLKAFAAAHDEPSFLAAFAQWSATFTHNVSATDLQFIKSSLPGPVLVAVGRQDSLVRPANSDHLAAALDARLADFPDGGHGVCFSHHKQLSAEIHDLITQAASNTPSDTPTGPGDIVVSLDDCSQDSSSSSSSSCNPSISDPENSPLLAPRNI